MWLIGDSTMSVKEKNAWPETGWGMPFANFFDSTVTVKNLARNGRSTRTFREEGLWKPVAAGMKSGDYVFIQFGHNDEVPTKKSATTPTEFTANLTNYIAEVKAKNAIPVLLSPAARRKFDSTSAVLQNTHLKYANLTRAVAKATEVIFIDVDEISRAMLQQLGPVTSKLLFNHLEVGEHPNYPNGVNDDTHFSELGARKIACMVLQEIRNSKIELAERIYQPPTKN